MEKNSDDKTIEELMNEFRTNEKVMNELMANEKVIEKALEIFRGQKVIINTRMYSSVYSSISIDKLDWIHPIGSLNQQHYIYISEYPVESMESLTENNLIFDIDNVDEAKYSKNTLKIFFQDGCHLYIAIKK